MNAKNIHKMTVLNIRREFLVCLFLVIVSLLVYGQTGNHEFIDFDDDIYVTQNHHVQAGLTPDSIAWAFTTTSIANWHPLTWLSHMLDIQLYGLNPGSHHLTNVFFHIANTLLLFLILTRMTGALWQSAFVAVLFAIHPLHVESVAWISERKDVLSTFFWMLTMWSYFRYVERPGVKRYLLILLFFILGLMVKPMLVTLPFVLLLMDYWPLCRFQFSRSGGAGPDSQPSSFSLFLVWEKIPFIILAAVFSVVTFLVQRSGGAVGSLEIFPLHYRMMNALVSYVSYIGKMIWPFNLAFLYPYPVKLPWWHVSGAFLLLLSISLLSIRNVRRFPWFAVGWLWYLGTLVPVIGLVQIGSQAMADRYTYVPLIGLFIIIAWGIPELVINRRISTKVLALAAAVFLLMLTVITWSQVRYWRNSVTLFEHTLDVTEDNYVIHNNLGFALAEINRTPEAIWHYYEALRINPRYEKAHNNIGTAFMLQGQLERAVEHFSNALRLDPDFRNAHYNLALALEAQGKYESAIHHYAQALRVDPDYAKAHNNLGVVLIHAGRLDEAAIHFQEALRIRPDYTGARYNLQKILKP